MQRPTHHCCIGGTQVNMTCTQGSIRDKHTQAMASGRCFTRSLLVGCGRVCTRHCRSCLAWLSVSGCYRYPARSIAPSPAVVPPVNVPGSLHGAVMPFHVISSCSLSLSLFPPAAYASLGRRREAAAFCAVTLTRQMQQQQDELRAADWAQNCVQVGQGARERRAGEGEGQGCACECSKMDMI